MLTQITIVLTLSYIAAGMLGWSIRDLMPEIREIFGNKKDAGCTTSESMIDYAPIIPRE